MRPRATPSPRLLRAIASLQTTVQRDEGGRGIGTLCRPGQLLAAALHLLRADRGVHVLTGFPCLRERTPPTETDGPAGAVAVARALCALGLPVWMPIEMHSEVLLRRCVGAACDGAEAPEVVAFPASDHWGAHEDARLASLREAACTAVAIERAGPSSDGVCWTMRCLPMGGHLMAAQLNSLLAAGSGLRTIGVGDGGNELGMGSLHADVCRAIPHGATIACVVPSDAPLVASVSNWGGYALCCAIALLAFNARLPLAGAAVGAAPSAEEYLDRLVPEARRAEATIRAANEAGAVDGTTGEGDGSVDGLPLAKQLAVLAELRQITLAAMADVSTDV